MADIDSSQIETVREVCQAMKDGRWLALSSADAKFIAETFLHVLDQKSKDRIVTEDLSMLIRMMVTKFRRGKLDEEYCSKAMDYLERKGLQGSVIRAMEE